MLPADVLPLQLQQRALISEGVGPLVHQLHANVRLNPLASTEGGAVLGLTSPVGPSSFLDITVGKVRGPRTLPKPAAVWEAAAGATLTCSLFACPLHRSWRQGACWHAPGASCGG